MPVIVPLSAITPCTVGADSNSLSRKIAMVLPSWRVVICRNTSPPSPWNSNPTMGLLSWSKAT